MLFKPPINLEINELIRESQKGNKKAQGLLYTHFAGKMYGVCMRYASDKDDAQDFLQDGFVHLFKKIDQFRFEGSFEGWVRRLFVNLILQKFRSKKLLYATNFEISPAHEPSYEHILEEIEARDLLEMVKTLSPQYRLVFNLYAIEGYSHKEVAKKLQISEGTSKSNLSRARSILQEKIAIRYPDVYQMKSNGG